MSHINKGDIHAYLDGALGAYPEEAARHVREHLDACPECAQLLDDEKRLREEASAILAASTVGPVELDSFEELRARAAALDVQEGHEEAEGAERTGRAHPSLGSRLYSLRWAATVVISLGAGWMAREITGPTADLERVSVAEPVASEIEIRSSDDQELRERQDPQQRQELAEAIERGNAGRLAEAETPLESPSVAAVGGAREADQGAAGFDDDAVLDQVEAVSARQRAESTVARGVGPTDADITAQATEPQVDALSRSDELRPTVSAPVSTWTRLTNAGPILFTMLLAISVARICRLRR